MAHVLGHLLLVANIVDHISSLLWLMKSSVDVTKEKKTVLDWDWYQCQFFFLFLFTVDNRGFTHEIV